MSYRCRSSRLPCAALLGLALLAGCGKFEDDASVDAPEPLPEKPEWRVYGEMPDFTFYADVNSINRENAYAHDDNVYVWIKQAFKTEQVYVVSDEGKVKGRKAQRSEYAYHTRYARMAIDCKAGAMAGTAVALHDKEGEEVERWDIPGYSWEFEPPTPNTYGGDFIRQICQLEAKAHSSDAKKN